MLTEEGYGFSCYLNNSDDSTLKETVTYTKFEGLSLLKPYKDSSYEVTVAPGETIGCTHETIRPIWFQYVFINLGVLLVSLNRN